MSKEIDTAVNENNQSLFCGHSCGTKNHQPSLGSGSIVWSRAVWMQNMTLYTQLID